MNVKCMLGVSAVVFFSCAFQAKSDINWLTSVSDGYYNDSANWTGGVIPTNAAIGKITGNNDYTIRFPAGGLTENSVTRVGQLSNGRSVTFDTTGTWWLKSGPDAWPNDWTGFQMQNIYGSHVFNIEGLIKTPPANDYPIMLMSNAIFRVQSYSSVITNVLEQGLLNLYDPGGVTRSNHSLITGSGGGTRHYTIIKAASTFLANQIRMRGSSPGNVMIFEGGNHTIYGGLQISEGATNAGVTNSLFVKSGTLSIPGSTLYIGYGKTGSYAEMFISGDGSVNVHNEIKMATNVSFPTNTSLLSLSDNASLSTDAYFDAAYASYTTATIVQENSSSLSIGSNLAIARGNNTASTMTMHDQTTCFVGGYLLIGGYSGSDGLVRVQDNAELSVANYCKVGSNSGTGRLELAGGEVIANRVIGDVTGTSEFFADGGTIIATNISGSVNLVEDFDLAELGNAGLTVDSAGYDIAIDQSFTDADSSEGFFIKTGTGILTATSSSHAHTLISEGELLLTDTEAQFGRSLVITNGASLSLEGTTTNLTAGDLTIGTTADMAFLYMDSNDSITITNGLTINQCGIIFGAAATNGTYTLFRSKGTAINPSVVDNIHIINPSPGKDYDFAVVPDGGDSTIQLTISAATIQETLWDGSESSDWNTADNWTPASVPSNGTFATFNNSGAEKTVNISSQAECSYLIFDSASPYLIQGETLLVNAGGVSNVLGSHTLSMPLTTLGDFSVQTTVASTTTISETISAYQSPLISKNGSGTVVVSGDNTGFSGKWDTSGGRLNFAAPTAMGDPNTDSDAITVGAGTLTYSGSPATVTKDVIADTGSSISAAIFETMENLTVNGPLSTLSGIIVKCGSGYLSFDIGNGTYTVSAGDGSGGVNITPAGTITLPESGDTPVTATGLGGMNVLDGTLCFKGNGPSSSILNQLHFGIVGGKYSEASSDPTLELDNVRMNQGNSGKHFVLGNQMSVDSPARTPTLRIINNALLSLNHLRMGLSPTTTFSPTLIMTNSSMTASWQISIGTSSDSVTPVVRLMQGSIANVTGNAGVYAYRNVDVLVAENSILSQTSTSGSFRFYDSASRGTMRFESGGTMRFTKFQGNNYNTSTGLNVYFNNGVINPIASGYSYSTAADKQSFIIEAGGLTVNTASGVSHSLTFPITGAGNLTKTGEGELVFGEGLTYTSGGLVTSGLTTGSYTGETIVAEGTLTVSNGTIRSDARVNIDTDATLNLSDSTVTLGSISGTGTILSGTLYSDYHCNVAESGNDNLVFEDVTLPAGLTVTFDAADGYSLTNHQVLAIATQSGTTDLNVDSWKSTKINDSMLATFTLNNDTVYAEIRYVNGTVIVVR